MQVSTNYSMPNTSTKFTGSLSPKTYVKLLDSIKTIEQAERLERYTQNGLVGPKNLVVSVVKEFIDGAQKTFFEVTNTKSFKLPKVRLKASDSDLPYNLDTVELFNREHVKKAQNVWAAFKK